jgi:hypothetical protein
MRSAAITFHVMLVRLAGCASHTLSTSIPTK